MEDKAFQSLMNKEDLLNMLTHAYKWVDDNIFNASVLYQLIFIIAIFFVASFFSKGLRKFIEQQSARFKFLKVLSPLSLFLVWLPLQWASIVIATNIEFDFQALKMVASMLTAWIFIRIISSFIHNKPLAKILSVTIWCLAVMNIIGVLDEATEIADKLAVSFGDIRLSVLGLVKAFISLAILLSITSTLSKTLEKRISKLPNISPSAQVLFGKLLKIIFLGVAVLVALETLGIDLTAFAVFGGALGVGIGFGLQKVISNFVSGLILLLERSLKPGDVIAIGETYGWVQSLGARYVSLITRDGTEHLIPNEEFITTRVENWSYSSDAIRLTIPVGISYNSDLDLALEVCLEAVNEVDRVLDTPEASCSVRGFGDSSVDLIVRFWISDPTNGRANVISDVYRGIWHKFHENNIEIPFPQRDLHIKSPEIINFKEAK